MAFAYTFINYYYDRLHMWIYAKAQRAGDCREVKVSYPHIKVNLVYVRILIFAVLPNWMDILC